MPYAGTLSANPETFLNTKNNRLTAAAIHIRSLPFFLTLIFVFLSSPGYSKESVSLLEVTPYVTAYASEQVKPVPGSHGDEGRLARLLKVSRILIDPERGVHTNGIKPSTFILYDKLDFVGLGFLITWGLTIDQRRILKEWHRKYMGDNPADVFFAPTADDIVRTRAAFGCSHYARAFIAVVKSLRLVDRPESLRYVVSCKADDYNNALEAGNREKTINGHQFVLAESDGRWAAINTSKGEWIEMPDGFSPDRIGPPDNVTVRFQSYPDVVFALRKIGKDYNDGCNDDSLFALMNLYRSGDEEDSDFRWKKVPLGDDPTGRPQR